MEVVTRTEFNPGRSQIIPVKFQKPLGSYPHQNLAVSILA